MNKEGLSMHKNGFVMTFANLSLLPIVVVLFVLRCFSCLGGKSAFVLLIKIGSLHSTGKTVKSFVGLGLE